MPAKHVNDTLLMIENDSSFDTKEKTVAALAKLGLEDFGDVFWHMPMSKFPRLSSLLPPMASPEVTTTWTGTSGRPLLQQSAAFVRSCSENYTAITGSTLHKKRILDFGCGYGRFLRLFSYYTNEIRGVDAWNGSLEHCRSAGLGDLVALSAEVPTELPYTGHFDFAFAFSVFTHLSEESTLASLGALRRSAKPGSVLCITFRPVEFWAYAAKGSLASREAEALACEATHLSTGFAYLPHLRANSDKPVHYGDTSFEQAWLEKNLKGWRIAALDRSLNDSLQRYAFLVAV